MKGRPLGLPEFNKSAIDAAAIIALRAWINRGDLVRAARSAALTKSLVFHAIENRYKQLLEQH